MVWSQSSFQEKKGGRLYLVPTPIGNLEDITLRALETLRQVDGIACEDTRWTRKLLNHYQIEKRLISYHEHNKRERTPRLLQALQEGQSIALVSDAGMPALSDPGAELVQQAVAHQIPVISLPGATAGLTALIASGFHSQPFLFYGFLQRKPNQRRSELKALAQLPYVLIFYEAPHRLRECLADMMDLLGNRRAALARELTKQYEEYVRGTLTELKEWAEERELKGEFTLIVDKPDRPPLVNQQQSCWAELSVADHVQKYIDQGLSPKEAIKRTAVERDLPKREVYHAYHQLD